jgi:outer membrane protein OmpA-like peptidoglycan-associated protein
VHRKSLQLIAALIFLVSPTLASAQESGAESCVGKVRLRGAIYDYQAGKLLAGVGEMLDGVATAFKQRCGAKLLIIEVHAFEMPAPELNLRLSELRAYTLVYELAQRGIPRAQMLPAALGDTRPLAAGATPDAMETNRRVTFRTAD